MDEGQGSGYVILGYARSLRELGCDVEVIGAERLDIAPWMPSWHGVRHRLAIGMGREVLARLAQPDFDVLEIFGVESWIGNFLVGRYAPRRDFLLVHRSNGLEPHAAERMLANAAERSPAGHLDPRPRFCRSLQWVDGLVTVSEWDARWGRHHLPVPADRILAIENALAPEFLGREPRVERERVIVFCGTWIPRKGIETVIRELPPVLRRHDGWHLVLAGTGAGNDPVREFPEDVRRRITCVPNLERVPALRALLERAAILVLPSHYESFGLVVSEAMACGCAVVATPVGFAADLEDGIEVLHASAPGDVEHALDRLIDAPQLRYDIARSGWQRVQSLTWDGASRRLLSLYESWLEPDGA